jgi:hypothetical protein
MFKATPVLLKTIRRLPLSTKQAKKDYYKGNNVGNMGSIDQFGRFKVEWDKVRTYVYPEDGAKVRISLPALQIWMIHRKNFADDWGGNGGGLGT